MDGEGERGDAPHRPLPLRDEQMRRGQSSRPVTGSRCAVPLHHPHRGRMDGEGHDATPHAHTCEGPFSKPISRRICPACPSQTRARQRRCASIGPSLALPPPQHDMMVHRWLGDPDDAPHRSVEHIISYGTPALAVPLLPSRSKRPPCAYQPRRAANGRFVRGTPGCGKSDIHDDICI
ncbi:hypothetical protein BD309DRAFT_732573 [Dichomitus squalens]|uniref:Uncharacterized protein n=1 Tax=Dichomitus squalens TaxID=114155 RepID=A0A4Q9Q355_9APHY|nr:hypothetical protein BD309DRAFT_732573 [Dichomitus squalens]TBU61441.1 hypothetical protein BD310DRAFT_195490 [Dichomitus squalens]